MHDGLVGKAVEQRADRSPGASQVAARQVRAADGALEEHVAGEEGVLAATAYVTWPGLWPGVSMTSK
jgi:hypothetical protein